MELIRRQLKHYCSVVDPGHNTSVNHKKRRPQNKKR